MKIEIEVYKGQTIFYNDDSDKFECEISIEDNSRNAKRGSLNALRKEIDQFIKVNVDFKPFKAFKLSSNYFTEINFSSIRTDGKFVVTGEWRAEHYGKKDLEKVMTFNAELLNRKIEIEKKYELARKERDDNMKELCALLKPIDLSKYEHIINPE